jgi:hypothetical protein
MRGVTEMKQSTRIYKCLREMANHIPYKDIEIDIETLKKVDGGGFIIGIRQFGTSLFSYRKWNENWKKEFDNVNDTWPRIEWYCGSVNEGWLIPLSKKEAEKMLLFWQWSKFSK